MTCLVLATAAPIRPGKPEVPITDPLATAELEANEVRIGEIIIECENIFDLENPEENNPLESG